MKRQPQILAPHRQHRRARQLYFSCQTSGGRLAVNTSPQAEHEAFRAQRMADRSALPSRRISATRRQAVQTPRPQTGQHRPPPASRGGTQRVRLPRRPRPPGAHGLGDVRLQPPDHRTEPVTGFPLPAYEGPSLVSRGLMSHLNPSGSFFACRQTADGVKALEAESGPARQTAARSTSGSAAPERGDPLRSMRRVRAARSAPRLLPGSV